MTLEVRLAQVVSLLKAAGIDCLVMGGHAVRHYGVHRNTNDFDFCAGVNSTDELRAKLRNDPRLVNLPEGQSWRPDDFARFELGKLPDGREEWLEFWIHNHLLPGFSELKSRAEQIDSGGVQIQFISLLDLLRSKETERDLDWHDIDNLEAIQDSRNLATISSPNGAALLLSRLRSRKGFEQARVINVFRDDQAVRSAMQSCEHPVTFAMLYPLAPQEPPASLRSPIDPGHLSLLRDVSFGDVRHIQVVEVIRRAFRRHAMELDRRDKQAKLRERG